MPIPRFTIDGVLPPFIGPNGPGGAHEDLSPYVATATEVVTVLGTSSVRREILTNWLRHRAALRAAGFDRGFQWLDGSFVEEKDPNDLDIVSFLHRPNGYVESSDFSIFLQSNQHILHAPIVKFQYKLDFFPVDLNSSPETLVSLTKYWIGLFSHRRYDYVWKGIVQVDLNNADDDESAIEILQSISVQITGDIL
ncbi:MAG: hypothetical protein LW830_11575 [Phenylobacterium sp.]|jgi:hypothetical protein|nr:hypothetical protein [Phenylobacterium sp.]